VLFRVLYAPSVWPRWVGHPRPALAVSVGACGSCSSPSPTPLRARVDPLVSFAPLQSPFASYLPPSVSRQKHLPWGCAPSWRRPSSQVYGRAPIPHRHPPSAFRTPSTVSTQPDVCRFISPCCHVQGSPYRGFSSLRSRSDSSPAASLTPVGPARLSTVAHRLQLTVPQPQGFSLHRESVNASSVLPAFGARSPPGFLPACPALLLDEAAWKQTFLPRPKPTGITRKVDLEWPTLQRELAYSLERR
jgi:hypothetical protein